MFGRNPLFAGFPFLWMRESGDEGFALGGAAKLQR